MRLLLFVALLALWPAPAAAAGPCFRETGYCVADPFGGEFRRLGGVDALGYPASNAFEWEGFRVQVFQRFILQWHPECACAMLVNVFDRLHELGKDQWLLATRMTPTHHVTSLAVLDAWPALRAKYDPGYGVPTSDVEDMGPAHVVRLQRAVLQQWKEDVPWARRGQVTVALGGDIAKEAGVLPSQRRLLGYYAPWDGASWSSLVAHADGLDYVAAQWVSLDACGGVGSRDDRTLARLARAHGVGVLPSLYTASAWLNHRVLSDPAASQRAIDGIVAYVEAEDYAGFDLDLEFLDASDRRLYTAFVGRLADALHAQGRLLTLAIPPKERDVTTGWAGAYDYAALGRYADLITVMGYEYHGVWSGPGPIAPHGSVAAAMGFAASQIAPERLLLGLGLYGYDWNVTTPGLTDAYGNAEVAWLAQRYDAPLRLDPSSREATFRYRAPSGDARPTVGAPAPSGHEIAVRSAPQCGLTPPPGPPAPTPPPRPAPGVVQEHEVWVEDAASAAARMEIAEQLGTGVAFWRLGQEDPATWNAFAEWRR